MALVRQLDVNHDWTFGKGRNNYLKDQKAVMQNIKTRLLSFLGNCFFDQGAGIDWFNFLGGKDQLGLELAINSVILNTAEVLRLVQTNVSLNRVTRKLTIQFEVVTSFTTISSAQSIDVNINEFGN